jgi:hypothetical protein
MSLIGKNPFVNEVLASCSAEQLTAVGSLINNLGSPTVIKLKELKNTDKGVKYASVFLDDYTLVHGLWIYTNTKCGLFAFQNGFNEMQAVKIDTVNKNYEYVYQHLSVTEFRSTLDDMADLDGTTGYSKTEADAKFLSKTDAASDYATKDSVYTKTESDGKYVDKDLFKVIGTVVISDITLNQNKRKASLFRNGNELICEVECTIPAGYSFGSAGTNSTLLTITVPSDIGNVISTKGYNDVVLIGASMIGQIYSTDHLSVGSQSVSLYKVSNTSLEVKSGYIGANSNYDRVLYVCFRLALI